MKHALKQNKVRIRDLKGREHIMTRANATDMVQHAGWSIVFDQPPEEEEDRTLSNAPRAKRAVHEIAQEQIANARGVAAQRGTGALAKAKAAAQAARVEQEDDDPDASPVVLAKPGRQPRVRAAANENEGEEAVAAIMPAVKAHALAMADLDDSAIDALEREESAREPKGE